MCYIGKICKFFILLVLSGFSLSAQTVTSVSGYSEIDLSALNPLGAVLSSAEASTRRGLMNMQTPSFNFYLGVGASISKEDGTWNARMSPRFQVMHADHIVGETDWVTAYNQCKSYNGESGGGGLWRLPTQRELIMIWILHPQLIGVEGFNGFSSVGYWSATEANEGQAWFVFFGNGGVNTRNKDILFFVRCVRDL